MDENTRRLWAAIEAKSRGRDGITLVSNATGLSRTTITTTIKALDEADESVDNIRRPSGGRRRLTETAPALLEDLEKLLAPVTRGASESPWRWTCKSPRKLAAELEKQGYRSSARQASQLLLLRHVLSYYTKLERQASGQS